MKTLLCTLTMAALCAAAATAGTATLTLDNPNQTAAPGDDVEFFGTITNTGSSTLYLLSDSFSLAAGDLTFDDSPFFANTPAFLLAGASTGDVELFDVTVSDPLLFGSAMYPGSWDVQGGDTSDAQDLIATADFSVSTTPEPSTAWLLLGGGLAGVFPALRRRYFA